jgi:hypothetical protein
MSDLRIKDGGGSGSAALVDTGRLQTDAVIESSFHRLSEEGFGWTLSMPKKTLTTTGGQVLWAAANDLPLHIFGIHVGWNGGSTNHNRMVELEVRFQSTVPTALNTELLARDARAGVTRIPDITAHVWNGSSDGMTGSTEGILMHTFTCGPGYSFISLDGSLLVSTDVSFSINAKPEEVGTLTLSMHGYQEEV